MKATVKTNRQVEIKYLRIDAAVRYWEDGQDRNSDNGFVVDDSRAGFFENYFPEADYNIFTTK